MMKGRNIGVIALLGGSTAALAMLTGLAGARADDLKVNQQLLSERLDQLAAVGLQPGGGAYLGIDQNKVAGAGLEADRGELVEPLGEELLIDLEVVGAGAGESGQHSQRRGAAAQHCDGADLTLGIHCSPNLELPCPTGGRRSLLLYDID